MSTRTPDKNSEKLQTRDRCRVLRRRSLEELPASVGLIGTRRTAMRRDNLPAWQRERLLLIQTACERVIMHFDIYTTTAAALCVSHLVLSAAAITLCVLLFRCTRSTGWLFLAIGFIEPLYRVAVRLARGLPPLWYSSSRVGRDGVPTMVLNFDIPTLFIFAVVGLYLLYRRFRHEPSA